MRSAANYPALRNASKRCRPNKIAAQDPLPNSGLDVLGRSEILPSELIADGMKCVAFERDEV
eukprot:m.577587 g.577587  ORF g.577587 m.577587 type:complete len:62 (+) comp57914_c0_seq1:3340-3525(+)